MVEGGTVSHATFNNGAKQSLGEDNHYPELEDHDNLITSISVNSFFNNGAQVVDGRHEKGENSWQGISSGDTFNGESTQQVIGTGKVERDKLSNSLIQTLEDNATSTGSVFTASSLRSVSN